MNDEGSWPAPGRADDPWSGRKPLPMSVSWSPDAARAAAAERRGAKDARMAARPRVPAGPGWLPLAAVLAGLVGAIALPDSAPGLGSVLTTVVVAAALVPALRRQLTGWTVGAGTAAVVLAGMSGVRDAEWLVAIDVVVAFLLGSIVLAGGTNFRELLRGGAALLLASPMAAAYACKPLLARARQGSVRRLSSAARASALTVGLLVVFGALFASADEAFSNLADRLIPSLSFDLLPVRVVVFAVVAGVVAAGAAVAAGVAPVGLSRGLHRLADVVVAPLDPAYTRHRSERVEWMLPLAVLNALFGLFVAVQFAVFFGGRNHLIATPGLTAAEHARSGFFQLLTVCLLTLAIIAAAVRWVPPAERLGLRLLLGSLCALTGVVLVSAWLRLRHYEEAFGYTRLRLVVTAAMVVIGCVLVLLLVAGALWRVRWLPRAVLVVLVAAVFALNAINADAFIARRNIDRAAAGAELDRFYLGGLSADAAHELTRLPEPTRSCALAAMRERLDRLESGWRGANLARARARSAVKGATGHCELY